MKLFRSLLAAAALASLAFTPIAEAQTVQSSVYSYPGQRVTYSATKVGFGPASSATDFLVITGSASKPVRVNSIRCNGVSTAAAAALIQVVKRSAADTGTRVAMTAVPLNSISPAATAVVGTYAANPTLGAAVGTVAAGLLQTTTLASNALAAPDLVFDFSNQSVILNGVAQILALNANAASLSAGAAINCAVNWSEG